MKEKFIRFANKMILPICIIMICHSLFRDYIDYDNIPGIFIIRVVLFICAIVIFVSGTIDDCTKKRTRSFKSDSFKEYFYLHSFDVVQKIFVGYFVVYILFRLDEISSIFSFLMILILGIFYGHRIASIANSRYKSKYKK